MIERLYGIIVVEASDDARQLAAKAAAQLVRAGVRVDFETFATWQKWEREAYATAKRKAELEFLRLSRMDGIAFLAETSDADGGDVAVEAALQRGAAAGREAAGGLWQ